jgi:hypothetical protein
MGKLIIDLKQKRSPKLYTLKQKQQSWYRTVQVRPTAVTKSSTLNLIQGLSLVLNLFQINSVKHVQSIFSYFYEVLLHEEAADILNYNRTTNKLIRSSHYSF